MTSTRWIRTTLAFAALSAAAACTGSPSEPPTGGAGAQADGTALWCPMQKLVVARCSRGCCHDSCPQAGSGRKLRDPADFQGMATRTAVNTLPLAQFVMMKLQKMGPNGAAWDKDLYGSQMPEGTGYFSPEELKVFQDWFDAGMPQPAAACPDLPASQCTTANIPPPSCGPWPQP